VREPARSGLVTGLTLAVMLAAYPLVMPSYQWAVRTAANVVLEGGYPRLHVEPIEGGGWRIFRSLPDRTEARVFSIPARSLAQIHLAIILLPALLFGVPSPLRQRIRRVGLGCALLYGLQVGLLVIFVKAWLHYQQTDPGDLFYNWLTLLHSTLGQLGAAAIWVLLAWPILLRTIAAGVAMPSPSTAGGRKRA